MEEEVSAAVYTTKPERAKLQLSSSPPPNCAICLSDCDNKSFTDRCMHQFCFACLLRWSKVKAECPLCKQPFKSIIHTVRSNSDYEEFTVLSTPPPPPPPAEEFNHEDVSVDFEQHYYLPPPPRQRRFQYRTTLYLDPHEDIAIQQMLMSHPLTNTLYMPRRRLTRLIGTPRPANSLDFRHAIYQHNWWVNPASTADITGRYRECSPQFYRENPAQRNRIAPWLHRELNALLNENGPHVLYVMSIINNLLVEHHVQSQEFRTRIYPYFSDKTDHFIHEFYNFLRSPYDMIGYDRNLQYTQRIQNIELGSSSSSLDSDSDVEIVNTQPPSITIPSTPPPSTVQINTSEVIVLSHSDTDNSDVIYQEPTPPPVVTISDSEEDGEVVTTTSQQEQDVQQEDEPTNQSSTSQIIEYKKENVSEPESTTNNSIKNGYNDNASTSKQIDAVDSSSCTPILRKLKRSKSDSDSSYKDSKMRYRLKLRNTNKTRRQQKLKVCSSSESSGKSSSESSDEESNESSHEQFTYKGKRMRKRIRMISPSESSNSSSYAEHRKLHYGKKRRLRRHSSSSSDESERNRNKFSSITNSSGGSLHSESMPSTSSYIISKRYDRLNAKKYSRLRSVVTKPKNYDYHSGRLYNHRSRNGDYSSSSSTDD